MKRRRLLIGAVALVRGGVRDDGKAMASICDELEPYFSSESVLENAPFDCISLILRYGVASRGKPEIGRINKQHSELEVAYELSMNDIRRMDYEALRDHYRAATLETLLAVSERFGLQAETWKRLKHQE
ncbi:MAG: immunity protein 39 [Phycisphaerales bacterium]|nr:immunity protein 39 [Phycisphaerales bacterium]